MLKRILIALLIALIAIQFIPVDRSNPPVIEEPKWDSVQTRNLAVKACFDCHSNEVNWPWYSYVAPVSFLVAYDVEEGREHLNFSEPPWGETEDAAEEVEEGEMPLPIYLPLHPEAKLTPEEKTALINGLKATFGEDEKHEDDEEEHHAD